MLSQAQNTYHDNPRLHGPVSSMYIHVRRSCTITPVTSIICIPLPIGVLGKRGTLEDKNTNDKCHGREWWVGKIKSI